MHHIFVLENYINLSLSKIVIEKINDKENFDHLVKSLRIKVGEMVLCSPIPFAENFSYKCNVSTINDSAIELDILEKISSSEPRCKINLYQGLPKSDKFEFIIEKAVEIGAYTITPVEMSNSVARINEKIEKKLERYNKIAKSAAEQSKRNIIPKIRPAIDYKTMLDEISNDDSATIMFYEDAAGIEKTKAYLGSIKNEIINIIIGPEGGFTKEEVESAKKAGVEILSLGKRILRTETAAIIGLGICIYEKG